ncbi:zinc-binding alcohol dehydrogenase family protein [Granulicella sp. L46]|uniref:zinc-binding alcohol dehydrogenase family protein n=1 Tax=Granulicella sp. L46 TaxID=1641865 RepID=UPI00131E6373|nr:zinc-binding alcohol dehydrogenase family protein [Granulicella sp. L46]
MKAVVIREAGVASVESVPDVSPLAGEVLLKIRRIGLCGSDLNSFRGRNPMVSFPRIPGHEVAATVMEDVPGNPILKRGTNITLSPYTSCGKCAACIRDRPNACEFNQTLGVQRDGALTEYLAVPPDRIFTARLSLEALCLVEPLTIGFHAVARGRVESSDTVAIIGCGGVGLGAIAGSSSRGARAIGIDVDDDKLRIARAAGAHETINSLKEPIHDRLVELTAGKGPDVMIEAIGLPHTFRSAVEEVAFTGRVVYIGYAKEPVTYETRLFVQKELDILGSRNALPEDFLDVIRLLESGKFPVQEAISAIISLEDVPTSLQSWSANPGSVKKVIVTLDSLGGD